MVRESGPNTQNQQLMTVELVLQNQLPEATKFIGLLFQKGGGSRSCKTDQ